MKRNSWLAITFITAALLTAGCGSTDQAEQNHSDHTQHAPNGDLQELTASADQLPKFLDNQDPVIIGSYKVAAANRELLKSIPCYCGCGESAGHEHNGNCFIKEEKSDGSIVWDDHGTRCGVCMEIAVISGKMKEEGKSTKEIRNYIDQTYGQGYGKPTPTPMPS
ncbi:MULTISPECIES: PCYCGC domain-containing protein [Brevibacillus]|uniref:Lipoprotein n=1 Tax=Brevibacillus porteri TaxID=2126350 RepID=A0ABX5FGN3_9BACL|nr:MULTISPECIES: PCYCGC domain-containing protein [Brevibacillus]MDC0764672.1 PCYCGC domain-containing protein [Brevibacillus sp. AG]MED1801887.1 PCYCGC domain-containing protein [Brevibacillus porteri]MED2132448.1 PCYCGC domain-containing protein [Brevibacillus porteri]MED2745327.1 PCYCGC domain-containing protein [Brevibacillus porteri]MED2814396.1 PCYCGC domain-containing protein [Brevibacillus porteri]